MQTNVKFMLNAGCTTDAELQHNWLILMPGTCIFIADEGLTSGASFHMECVLLGVPLSFHECASWRSGSCQLHFD